MEKEGSELNRSAKGTNRDEEMRQKLLTAKGAKIAQGHCRG